MHLNKLAWVLAFATAASVGLGCEEEKKPAKTADDVATAPAPTTEPKNDGDDGAEKSETKSPVNIDARVTKMCDLPEPKFQFDSAAISGQAKRVLDAIAKCFKSGPGKGHNLNIVGHTDPRGEPEYNFGLGQKRAGSVANYLKRVGLEDDRIESSSRGELDATGTDMAGWSRDRRVDILLAD